MNILTIGLAGLGLYLVMQPKKTVSTVPSSGIIYKCDYIEVVDKDKFQKFITAQIEIYLIKIKNNLSLLDFKELTLGIIEKLNKSCYSKLVNKSASEVERVIALLIAWGVYENIVKFKSNFQNTEEDFNATIEKAYISLKKLIILEGFEVVKFDEAYLEDFFKYNENKFPVNEK